MSKQEIWKFKVVNNAIISMPEGARILSVQTQHNIPQMWVWVDPNQPTIDRYFEVFATGQEMHETKCKREYIGTYQVRTVNSGNKVYHVFELV